MVDKILVVEDESTLERFYHKWRNIGKESFQPRFYP